MASPCLHCHRSLAGLNALAGWRKVAVRRPTKSRMKSFAIVVDKTAVYLQGQVGRVTGVVRHVGSWATNRSQVLPYDQGCYY